MTLVDRAREFAREAHAARNATTPANHISRISLSSPRAGLSDEAVAAAWLHEVIEDQGVLASELVVRFLVQKVASMVEALTDTPPTRGLGRGLIKAQP